MGKEVKPAGELLARANARAKRLSDNLADVVSALGACRRECERLRERIEELERRSRIGDYEEILAGFRRVEVVCQSAKRAVVESRDPVGAAGGVLIPSLVSAVSTLAGLVLRLSQIDAERREDEKGECRDAF